VHVGDDQSEFTHLYVRSRARLAAQLYAFTGSSGEAADLVQEAFVRAWANWAAIRGFDDREAWVRKPLVGTSAVWTGHELVVVATYQVTRSCGTGCGEISSSAVVAEWVPGSRSWMTLPPPPPSIRTFHATATWTGTTIVLVGGSACLPSMSCLPYLGGNGGVYHPATRTWSEVPEYRQASAGPVAWTGQALIVLDATPGSFSGDMSGAPGDAAALEPVADSWTALPPASSADLSDATVAWTGRQLLIWGPGVGPTLGEALTAPS
jgi:Sigma-70 region 2